MDTASALQVASTLLLNLGFAWLVGSWFARRWLASGGVDPAAHEVALRRYDLGAAGLSAGACAASLWAATAVMAGVPLADALPSVGMMLTTTDLGRAGCITAAAMVGVFLIRLWGRAGRAAGGAALAALAAFAVTRASMGHAGEAGWWNLAVAAESIHLAAIGLWTGLVAVSGWFVLDKFRLLPIDTAASDKFLHLMSNAAILSVAALAGTGIYSAWHRVGSMENLLHSTYGIALLVKLLFVLIALALGGYNKLVGLPAASRSRPGIDLVRNVLRIESLVLCVVLLAAAILTSQQPPTAM